MREFGDQVAKGSIYALNPLTIIFLVPIVSAVTTNIDNFEAIQIGLHLRLIYSPFLNFVLVGAYLSAFSVFLLAFNTSLTACALFVFILSFGEV